MNVSKLNGLLIDYKNHTHLRQSVDYTMVNFIKPNFLGTTRDFAECYANPIRNGQHKDSSRLEVRVMKEKSYILHKKLSKFVQVGDGAYIHANIRYIRFFILIFSLIQATRRGHFERYAKGKIRI